MARVLVAGASRGIGLALCEAFAERGDHVIAAVRKSTPRLEELEVQVVEGIELTSDEAVGRLVHAVGREGLDVLIYNAAINKDARALEEIDIDVLRETIDVNALGAVRTVLALLPTLHDGSKIMLVSVGSRALNIGPMPSRGQFGYRMSKAALTSFGFGLAREVRDRGIAVILSSPGATKTDMLREVYEQGRSSLSPEEHGAEPLDVARMFRDRIDELDLEHSPAWQQRPTGESAVVELLSAVGPIQAPTS
jgi:NAD(P)-dependent dehydrogenase (short-subunit alcohol dehydrogenase family)